MENNPSNIPVDSVVAARQGLPVLPHSNKVDKLKEEFVAEGTVVHNTELASSSTQQNISPLSPVPSLIFGTNYSHKSSPDFTPEQRQIESLIVQAVRTIYDPEIPVNIYELGLIYEINIDAEIHVNIKMTLTAPGCPVAGSLPVEVEKKIEAIPQVKSADVELVWEPAWDKSRMSEAALLDLGLV